MAKSPFVLRSLAVLAAVAIPMLLAIPAVSGLLGPNWWIGSLIAMVCGVPIVVFAEPSRSQAMVGVALAGMAAASTPDLPEFLSLTADLDAMAVHDLRDGPLSTEASGYVAIRGFMRPEMVVDEYASGGRPNQNERPEAMLLPMLGTLDAEIEVVDREALGRVVIVRISPDKLEQSEGLQTIRGTLLPISDDLVGSLFLEPVPAVMLDTFDVPTRGQAITRAALAIGASILGLILLILSVPRQQSKPGDSDG